MKNIYKTKAVVKKEEGSEIWITLNNYSFLNSPVRSLLNKALKLKHGDKVEITVKVVKRKKCKKQKKKK